MTNRLKVLPPRFTLTDIIILVLLLLVGAIANYFPLTLPMGVDFVFGGIAVWLVVILYGTYWGTLAALITSLVTIWLWGHPYSVIIFTLETLFVAFLWHSRRRNLLLLDAVYWLCLGIPLIGLFFAGFMQLPLLQVGLILFKQSLNGIFNVFIANLIAFCLPLHYWRKLSRQSSSISFRQILFNLLLVLAIISLISLINLESHLAFDEIKNRVHRDLTAISTTVKTEIHRERHERLANLQELERIAETFGLHQVEQLQQSTEIFQKNQPGWQQIYITNSDGEVIVSSPPINKLNEANKIKLIDCNVREQFTVVPAHKNLQIKVPIFVLGKNSHGCVVGEIDRDYLRQLLLANRSHPKLRFSLIDSRDRLVVSTTESKAEITPHANSLFFNSNIKHQLPLAKNMSLMTRWQNSYFVQQQDLDDNLPWTLIVEAPAAPYINSLQQIYIFNLSKILLLAVLAWFFSYLLSRQLVNPLASLEIVTNNLPDKLSKNQHIVWPFSRLTEIESLTRNFQFMAEKLQEQFTQLQTINTTLEQRVENRTQELSKINQELQAEVAERKQTEASLYQTTKTLEKFSANLQQLHRINTNQYDNLEQLFSDCLETGRTILGLETGVIGQVSDRSYIILSAISNLAGLESGLELPLEQTYCQAVFQSQKTITYDRIGAIDALRNHPIYQWLKLESYISAPIFVNNKIYGTLCFCSTEVKTPNFDEREREIVELMAKTIGWHIAERQGQEKLQLQYQTSQLLSEVAFKIRNSLQLEEILEIAVTEVQKLLQSERVAIVHCGSDGLGKVIQEAIVSGFPSLINRHISELIFVTTYLEDFRQGRFIAVSENLIDPNTATIESNKKQILEFGVQASLGVPIFIGKQFWGLLLLQQCSSSRRWNDFEIEFSQQLADHIGIALSQSQLLQNLEGLVAERTTELRETNQRLQQELRERQLVEDALRKSEDKNHAFLEAIPDLLLRVNKDGSCLDFKPPRNSKAEVFLPIDKHLSEVLPPDLLQRQLEYIELALTTGELQVYEHLFVKHDRVSHEEVRISAMGENEVLILVRDITERKESELALQTSETRLAMAQQVAKIGYWEFDLESQKIFWSEETFKNWGFAPTDSEPTYAELLQKVHPEDRKILQQLVERAIAEGTPYTFDLRILQSDGSINYIDSRGKPILNERGRAIKIIGTSLDITDRKRTEEALRRSEEQLRLITDSLPVCISYINRDRRYQFVNKTYETWFGYSPEEIYGKQIVEIIGEAAYEVVKDKVERALSGEQVTYEAELPYRQGGVRYINAILVPDISSNQEVRGYYALISDISESKQAEEQLRSAQNRLSHLLSASPAIIYSCEPTDVYRSTFISNNVISLLGYESSQFTKTADFWANKLHPEDKSRTFAEMSQIFERKHLIVEYRFRHKDGSYRWLRDEMRIVENERGEAYEIIGCIIDISEHQQAEEALKASEARLRQLVELNLIGVMFWDIDGSVLDANDAFLNMVGYTREDVQEGRLNWRSLTPVEQLPWSDESLQKMQHQVSDVIEKEYIRKNGSRIPIMLGGVMFPDSQSRGVSFAVDLTKLKQAEATLRASEERFKAQYRGIPLPTYTWQQQGEELILIEYNHAAEIYTQGNISQIVGKTAKELYSDTPEVLGDFIQCLNEQTSIKRQMRYQMRSTGEWKNLIVNYAFIPPDMVIVHTEDITPLKQTQEELKAKNAEMKAIFEAFPDLFFRVAADGTILDYKARITSELYLQPEFLIGKPIREVLPSTVGQQCQEKITEALQNNSLASFEYSLPVVNTEKYYEARLVPLEIDRVIAIIRDISDRKLVENERQRAEEALRRSENQLRSIADALPILIAYVDSQQRYIFTNRAYEQWFGRTPGSLKGLHLQTVMSSSVYERVQEYLDTVLSGQRVEFEIEIPALEDNYHYLSVTYIPDLDEQQKVKGFFASLVDITERKAVERMKEEFLSVVSHELRTPLTAIHGSLKLLATGMLGQLSEQGLQMLHIADESCDRLVRLINDLLNFQRMNSGRVTLRQQNYNTAELIIKAVNAIQEMARQQNIILSTETISIDVWLDSDYILQVLSNLLGNAIKFSNPGTTIWLQVSEQDEQVLFAVRDEGRGIPPDKLESIFERFHQVDASDSRQKGGTGLGLAICRQIIELHGGKIWVESILGQGSTFYFTVPKIN